MYNEPSDGWDGFISTEASQNNYLLERSQILIEWLLDLIFMRCSRIIHLLVCVDLALEMLYESLESRHVL
jgi:hypothetical protein